MGGVGGRVYQPCTEYAWSEGTVSKTMAKIETIVANARMSFTTEKYLDCGFSSVAYILCFENFMPLILAPTVRVLRSYPLFLHALHDTEQGVREKFDRLHLF